MRLLFFSLILLTVCSCAAYRKSNQGYLGVGAYRSPSDVGPSVTEEPEQGLNPRTLPFMPRAPFQLSWPVHHVKLNRGYRPANDPKHEGLDLGGPRGSAILSAHEGVVIYTGDDFRGYGNMILVEYSDEWATLYGHLDSIQVYAGKIVEAGEPLGEMGNTGAASGVHLHFELLNKRKPVDPIPFLARVNRFAKTNRRRYIPGSDASRKVTGRPSRSR